MENFNILFFHWNIGTLPYLLTLFPYLTSDLLCDGLDFHFYYPKIQKNGCDVFMAACNSAVTLKDRSNMTLRSWSVEYLLSIRIHMKLYENRSYHYPAVFFWEYISVPCFYMCISIIFYSTTEAIRANPSQWWQPNDDTQSMKKFCRFFLIMSII